MDKLIISERMVISNKKTASHLWQDAVQSELFLSGRSLFRSFVRREAEVLQFGILAKHKGHNNNIFFRECCDIGYSVALVKTLKAMEFGFFQRTELFLPGFG